MRSDALGNNFDGVRLIASLMVLYSHAFVIHGVAEPNVLNLSSVGGFGVYTFFVVSGYLITGSLLRDKSVSRFLARRSLRIFPALIVSIIICAVFIGPITTYLPPDIYFTHEQFYSYFTNCFLYVRYSLPGSFLENPLPSAVNGSLWSLPIEFAMYLAILGAGLIGIVQRRQNIVLVAVSMGLLGHYVRMSHDDIVLFANTDLRQILFVGPYFFAGSVIYLYREKIIFTPPMLALLAAGGLALNGTHYIHLWGMIAVPYMVMAVCLSPTRWLSIPKRVGDISYGVYLYSFPVQQSVEYFSKGSLSLTQAIALGTGLTILCAIASWKLIESPALSLKPQTRRRTELPDVGQTAPVHQALRTSPRIPVTVE